MDAPPPLSDAILPLAVLEAMRHLDSPTDEEAAEFVDELLQKRLGLSRTVAAQIARYDLGVRRGRPVPTEEFELILRLAGRRPDAALVFADAGRRAARRAMRRLPLVTRWSARHLPRFLRRLIGFRAARRCLRRAFAVTLVRERSAFAAHIRHGMSARAASDGVACGFYGAAVAELLRHLISFDGAVSHPRCRAHGDEQCEWREIVSSA
jgi:hypothetical protein